MAQSYLSEGFIESKVATLIGIARDFIKLKPENGFATEEELKSLGLSLGNNMKKCYLEVGILIEGPKRGKSLTYKFDGFKLNEETVKAAYAKKALLKNNKELDKRNAQWDKMCKNGFDKHGNILPDKEEVTPVETETKTEDLFPSIEDCLKYLQHHYGMDVEVIPVKRGLTIVSYKTDLKKK